MKAISIKQPWASLIVHGIKDIENRTWVCPKKYIGQRVLIHASAKNDGFVRFSKEQQEAKNHLTDAVIYESKSAIIGSVQIVDCVINHPSIWAEKTENYTVGMNPKLHEDITGKKIVYNWVLANPILFKEPIPAKGKLSFWESDLTEEQINLLSCEK